ncbi:hypothetical protein BBP40_011562 [Aspergillus hancockii]|nr:hypothetical protein BBP40_011562 [Aspergillus hancockii]
MSLATLVDVDTLLKSDFKNQLRNRPIVNAAVTTSRHLYTSSCTFSTEKVVKSRMSKKLERPWPMTASNDDQRKPSLYTGSITFAKTLSTSTGFSFCQRSHRLTVAVFKLGSNARRSCTSSYISRPITERVRDTGDLQNIVSSSASATAKDTQPLPSKNSPPPIPPSNRGAPKFWSHRLYKNQEGKDITVHYCRTLEATETVAKKFLDDKVLGFDLEWKAQASAADSIQNNVSLIQLANKERIALFHVAMFRLARGAKDFVSPSLKQILESQDITKVGVSIKADCTRVRKFLGIDARAIFELSHLYKLVKYCHSEPKLINKRLVNLSDQVNEHFGLPLAKDVDVRCSDWTSALGYMQVQYAAADPYACLCLFNTMNDKRMALDPMPPLPAHAELNLPIRIVHETPVNTEPGEVEIIEPMDSPETKERL